MTWVETDSVLGNKIPAPFKVFSYQRQQRENGASFRTNQNKKHTFQGRRSAEAGEFSQEHLLKQE